jgi:hypothetical protein
MNAGQIIWSQISIQTKMACGARQAVGGDDGLHFTVGRSKLTKVRVTLDTAADLYDVEFLKFKRGSYMTEFTVVESANGIFAEDLSEVVYRMVNK